MVRYLRYPQSNARVRAVLSTARRRMPFSRRINYRMAGNRAAAVARLRARPVTRAFGTRISLRRLGRPRPYRR